MEDNNIPNHSGINLSSKRKAEGESIQSSKRRKSEESDSNSFMMFSDDILLIILSNLNHHDIVAISQTCGRLYEICRDHTLWRDIYFPNPTTEEQLEFMMNSVGPETKSFISTGYHGTVDDFLDTISLNCLSVLVEKCPSIKYLSLTKHYIDSAHIGINNFPRSLLKLDLSSTYIKNSLLTRSYFKDISTFLPELKILVLSDCKWLEPHSLMALSKCSKLEELYLDGCDKIKNCVAYCGLATRGGFKSLKTLDLRRCPIGGSELVCFASVTSLVNLYLQHSSCEDNSECPVIDAPIIVLFTREPMVEIRADGQIGNIQYPRLKIERLILRDYTSMTDESFYHLARDARHLKYLDVTGSNISQEAIKLFKRVRPEVSFIHS